MDVLVACLKYSSLCFSVPPTPIIETRLIYTQGVYKLSDAMRSCRQITIVSDLLRFPKFTVYANEKSNPPYYFLGYYTIWTGDYVQKRRPLEFTEQALLLYDNPVLQASNLLLAVGSSIQNTIQALGSVMTPPAIVVLLPQPDATAEACPYTDIKFKMPLGTRIQVTAVGIPLEEYGDAQRVAPSLHQPADTVPRYPLDREPALDPPRSEPYPDEVPGDTAPATPEDPDSGLAPPAPCVTVVRGSGLNVFDCGSLGNHGDYSYNGYAELRPINYLGCPGLRLFLDGVDLGDGQTYYADAIILSRTGTCLPP